MSTCVLIFLVFVFTVVHTKYSNKECHQQEQVFSILVETLKGLYLSIKHHYGIQGTLDFT